MPRGQKSKRRAREKRRKAKEDTQDLVGARATAASEKESPSSSSYIKGIPQSLHAAGTCSMPQEPHRAPSTSTPAVAVSYTISNENDNEDKESPSCSQTQLVSENLYQGPIDKKVIVLVHYLLYKYQLKEPITKADMLKNVIQTYRNHYLEILRKASEHLELVFGLDLKEVDPNRHTYILINKLELSFSGKLGDGRDFPKTGLLMTILGVIFTKGNCTTEEEMWEVLNMMGIYAEKDHFIFGNPQKLLTKDFVKAKYLEYRQVPHSDPPSYEFLWGPRAHAETSKMKVLEFLAKAHDTIPSAFPTWYEEALRDEEERARARVAARARTRAMASARSKTTSSNSSCPK
ncbi:melanoma-associated antigen B10-like [Tamandua tetradactyla]|uniref:melanoma-associated antigen B10-like n=1 Tax=Tamandua tetradactyla TaxID=48850 RepID=UPI0040548FC7